MPVGELSMEQRQTASPRLSEAAEEPLGPNGDEIPSRAGNSWNIFLLHRPQSTAIYFNDENEQCSHVGLLRRFLILPGGDMKHRG